MHDNNVKVWNKNIFPHVEAFKGATISIEPKDYIEMDYNEAVLFLGQFKQPEYTKGGVQKPESYKFLEIDKEDRARVLDSMRMAAEGETAEKVFACHACNKEFRTKNGLLKHIKDKHAHEMIDKEAHDELLDNEDI